MSKQSAEGEGSIHRPAACAACRHQRRKCREDCVVAPHFPSHKGQEYLAVHRVFGFSNMAKMLSSLDDHQHRTQAVESLEWEALMWSQDPVRGPLGAYQKACDIIKNLLSQQTAIPSCETDNTWVLGGPPLVANDTCTMQNSNSGYCEPSLLSQSYVNRFVNVLGNEVEGKFGAAPDVLHPPRAFLQRSSMWQPSYLPSIPKDQQRQIRGFQLHRGLQGAKGNFENINSDGEGHGRALAQSGRARQA